MLLVRHSLHHDCAPVLALRLRTGPRATPAHRSSRYAGAPLFASRLRTALSATTAHRFFRLNILAVRSKHRLRAATAHGCFWLTIYAVLSKHRSLRCSSASLPLPHHIYRSGRALLFAQEPETANCCSFLTILAVLSDQCF